MKIEHQLARCLVRTAATLGYTLEPGDDVLWLYTASRHPDLVLEAIDAGAAHAAARYAHGLLTLTLELLRDDTTTDPSDPEWVAAHAARLAAADRASGWSRQRLGWQTSRYRRALERLVAAHTGLARRRPGVPSVLPPPRTPPDPDPAPGPVRQLVAGSLVAVVHTDPDGTTRLHATGAAATSWQVAFSPGTPRPVIHAACGAALAGANPPPATT
jgi:hypothetical protein